MMVTFMTFVISLKRKATVYGEHVPQFQQSLEIARHTISTTYLPTTNIFHTGNNAA